MSFNAFKNIPLGGLAEFRRFLYNAFILPCRDPKLAYLYVASMLFAFSSSFLDLFIVIDLMDMPMQDMMTYLILKNAGVSALVSVLFWMVAKFGGKLLYPLFISLITGGVLFCVLWPAPLSPLQLGAAFVIVNSPFWALYHVFFAISISDENVGNEVSLAGTGMTVGIALGFLAGGFVQSLEAEFIGTLIGFIGMAGGTLMMILHAYKMRLKKLLRESGALDETLGQAFIRCRYRSLGTFMEGIMQMGGGSLWVIFLKLAGISAAAVGIWNAVMVLVKIFFTPIAGSLINHGKRREMLLGSVLNTFGWVPFVLTTTMALPAMYIWSVGNQLYSSGLGSAWYQSRTVSSMMAREILLGVSRLICIPPLVLLLYHDTDYFIYVMVGLSALMIIYSLYWIRSIKIKGPVMAMENMVSPR